jgi:hypothetical protein
MRSRDIEKAADPGESPHESDKENTASDVADLWTNTTVIPNGVLTRLGL